MKINSWKSLLFVVFLAVGCSEHPKYKIVYVDSYDLSYPWSAEISRGVLERLKNENVEVIIKRMDTKRNPGEKYKKEVALKIKNEIDQINPAVLVASDDNAMKYLIKPYYRDSKIPVVFVGINWDASIYGAPYSNTTGMIEVTMISKLVEQLKRYAKGKKIGYIANDRLTARKEEEYTRKIFHINYNSRYVSSFAQWKKSFLSLQREVDILIIGNVVGIDDWNEKEAQQFLVENIRIPTGAFYEWLAPYSLVVISHSPYEHGYWGGSTAMKILGGKVIDDIPVVYNQNGAITINLTLAKKLSIRFPSKVLKEAQVYEID